MRAVAVISGKLAVEEGDDARLRRARPGFVGWDQAIGRRGEEADFGIVEIAPAAAPRGLGRVGVILSGGNTDLRFLRTLED